MTGTRGLVDGSHTPGIYRVLDPAAATSDALAAAGWSVFVVPPVTSVADLLTALADRLRFPDYFGRNLDALWDCLTDITVPTALVMPGWAGLAASDPAGWRAVLCVLRERTEVPPAFAVLLT